ncbi:MAG: hypothetical protein KA163_04615 [Bacteroidia bacterium]|nr:hypothetical protein [Bacteroidia bacterium]
MKKPKEDIPLQYFERNLLFTLFFVIITALFALLTYSLWLDFNPLMFICGVPTVILFFQTLWIMLNPFAIIYEYKFEFKKTMFSNKQWYFIDIKTVEEVSPKGFKIIYNDGDEEIISTFGIRPSHKKAFRDAVNHYVCKSLVVERAND